MKERIISALQETKGSNSSLASVIFKNNYTEKVSFYNGVSHEFEPITSKCFDELLQDGIIVKEKCKCQGDTRYILA
jgi:hypothetical protein